MISTIYLILMIVTILFFIIFFIAEKQSKKKAIKDTLNKKLTISFNKQKQKDLKYKHD